MASFSTLYQAQALALKNAGAGSALNGVAIVTEDVGNIAQKVAESLGELGMLVLIGKADFDNNTPQGPTINGKVVWSILVREFPEVWRDGEANAPVCDDVALSAGAKLQQLEVPGFQRIRVLRGTALGAVRPDEKKQIEFQDYRLDLEATLVS